MITVSTAAEARAWTAERRRAGVRVALVPTMGALHAGHLSLLAAGRGRAGAVALSIFVNPTQFGEGEDYARYPRDPERDAALAAQAGADLLFAPPVEELYPDGADLLVDPGALGRILEGAHRPAHFRGVATVVTKLLNALTPDIAVFGQKDAQQVLVVRSVVTALLLPVEILCAPTVRAADGVALSSRNAYLSPAERAAAPALRAALGAGEASLRAGERSAAAVEAAMRAVLDRHPALEPDYAAAVPLPDLRPAERLQGRILLALAARLGRTRLLDNLCLEVGAGVRPALP